MFRLPELGPLGSNGLANPRDFLAPVAAIRGQGGALHADLEIPGQPVGGRHEALAAQRRRLARQLSRRRKYDLSRFMVIGTISFDHPDPSIFSVLTAPSDIPGTANIDFVIFPPRWLVGEDTFRPPWYHRSGDDRVHGPAVRPPRAPRPRSYLPGSASLHSCMTAHGPDAETARARHQRRAQAAQAHRHHGVHVREPLRHAAHPLRDQRVGRAAARLSSRAGGASQRRFPGT